MGDEYGWKQVHGDVFRPAAKPLFFSALLGTGCQLLVVTVAVILFTIMGELYTERGSLLSTAIFVYAATSPINGYFGASIYAQMGGKVCLKVSSTFQYSMEIKITNVLCFHKIS